MLKYYSTERHVTIKPYIYSNLTQFKFELSRGGIRTYDETTVRAIGKMSPERAKSIQAAINSFQR